MYTIKEAAARTGLTVPVLRAWERRYGVVSPARTPGGYRLYDDEALARLRSMRRLIAAGWSASAAAAAVVAGEDGAAGSDVDGTRARESPDGGPTEVLANELLAASADLAADRIEAVLDDMFAAGSYERVVEDHVVPALHAIGDGWADGRVAVAGEHVASNAIQRRLAAVFQASGSAAVAGEGPILVGMPPGARHELGALIFATAARRAGMPVLYLGADLPVAEWVAAVERTEPQAVVIGAVIRADGGPAAAVANAVAARRPDLVIAYGGPAAPSPGPSDAAIRLPDDVREAIAALRGAIAARASG
jgi:MerR family transcriptional regulator, light-induced transcriptional regulator